MNNNDAPVNTRPVRVWLIPCSNTVLGWSVAERVLLQDDIVVIARGPRAQELVDRFPHTCSIVDIDSGNQPLCQSAVASVVLKWKRIDMVLNVSSSLQCGPWFFRRVSIDCRRLLVVHLSPVIVGAVEEIEEIHLRDQMEKTFYSAMNVIHAVLPVFREQNSGHILNVVDLNASMGTPGLASLSAAMHAVAAYTDSLALGLSKYNIKVTLIQVAMEVTMLTTSLMFVDKGQEGCTSSLPKDIRDLYAGLNVFPSKPFEDAVHGIVSVGGVKDPPSRLVCGEDAIGVLRQHLNLKSEELDAFTRKMQE